MRISDLYTRTARQCTAVITVATFAIIASCGGSSSTAPAGSSNNPGGPTTPATTNAVTVGDNVFSPSQTTVPAGTTVTWTWQGSARHNVTFDDGTHSASQSSGTFSRTFSTPGTYAYECTIHGSAMSGIIVVK